MSLTSDKTLRYNAKDAAATFVIAEKLIPEIHSTGYDRTYYHTIDLFKPLTYMMLRGVRVDLEKLEEMKIKVDAAITKHQMALNEIAGRPLNANSSDQLKQYFYVEKGIPAYTKYNKKTQSSSVTCDDKALQRLARPTATRKGFEEARLIQRIRQLRKLKGTYLDIVFDKDNRLRCSYNPRGTRFGRISSSKTIFQTGMNMQNLPPAFMHFLVADPGRIIFGFDKRQAEWVVVAYVSGDASMIKAIESGVDVHSYTASEMFKIPIDIVKAEHKAIGSESNPETIGAKRQQLEFMRPYLHQWIPRSMSMRQCGKKSNHGLNYDEKERMFALINEISEKEAKVIIDFYHAIYPGIRTWYNTTRNKLTNGRTLENLFGRKYRFLDKWNDELLKSAYSFVPQSTVGELVNRAMINVYNDNDWCTQDLELMMQVHDSLDFQDQFADVPRLVQSMRKVYNYMTIPLEANGRTFTIGTDLKVGFNMGTYDEKTNPSGMIEIRFEGRTDAEIEADLRTYIDGQKKT